MRIDLQEWQSLDEKPEFKENPYIPVFSIPSDVQKYINISEITSSGIKISALNYVGIFPISDEITITISPKAPIKDFLYILYKSQGKRISIKELEYILKVGYEKSVDYPNIFHFLTSVLLVELEQLKRFGFLKTAKEKIQDRIVSGKILIKDTLKNWMTGDTSKIICSRYDMSKINSYNMAIKYTLWMILSTYSHLLDPDLKHSFFEKYKWFNDIPLNRVIDFIDDVYEALENRTLPSSRAYYYDILNLSLFFIHNSTIDLRKQTGIKIKSFVVDMNRIFEDYIYNVLQEYLGETYSVIKEYQVPLFEDSNDFFIKPDYLIKKDEKFIVLLDAKYKFKPENLDVYQIFTYANKLNVENIFLIYPSWTKSTYIEQHRIKDQIINRIFFDLSDVKKSEIKLIDLIMDSI